MDVVLDVADEYALNALYPDSWPKDSISRQSLSLLLLTTFGGYALYFVPNTLEYHFFFDRSLMRHPKWLKDQISKEIFSACKALPVMALLTLPFFLAEVRGHTLLYDEIDERGVAYFVASLFAFLMFNDCLIYWIHRGLHTKMFYKTLHKEHHRWLVPSPFASHAFHPLDGFLQSVPYHLFLFIMPLNKWVYLTLFVLVNFWTISIHDGNSGVPAFLRGIVNGAAHHTDHHLYFNFNYGQYFTLWDRIGGSFREPSPFLGKGPKDDLKRLGLMGEKTKGG